MNYWINVTRNCNLNCTYCYQKEYHQSNNMDHATADRLIDFIAFENYANAKIHYFGGEPTLNFEIIQYITEKLEALGVERFSLTSNLTYVTDEMLDFFDRHHFSILASIDGMKESHDLQRKHKNGSGSFELAFANFKKAVARPGIELTIAKVLSQQNIQYFYEDYQFFKELGVPVALNLDNDNLLKNDQDAELFSQVMSKVYADFVQLADKSKFVTLLTWYSDYLNIKNGVYAGIKREACHTKDNLYLTFDHRGMAYPCHFMAEMNLIEGVPVAKDVDLRGTVASMTADYDLFEENEIISLVQTAVEAQGCNECKFAPGCLENALDGFRNGCIYKRFQHRKHLVQLDSPYCIRRIIFHILDRDLAEDAPDHVERKIPGQG